MNKKPRILISGGGTGGHIFPALSIADVCKKRFDAEILFVGAEGRMEMQRVPAAGYNIKGLPVAGFNRKNLLRNVSVLLRLWKSIRDAKRIIKDFKPDLAIGVGGYASGPTLKAAQGANIPTLLQEQNSYAGVTNKLLAAKADAICVAYDGMDKFFPAERIIKTGNPVRKGLLNEQITPEKARRNFNLSPDRPTLLVVGGSLGARTINESMRKAIDALKTKGIQIIWQTGKHYFESAPKGGEGVVILPFISDMAEAYAAATLVVSRAGAGTISELQLLGKPSILVPSPNVAEDHQTKNAKALVARDAALMIPDSECEISLLPTIESLILDENKLNSMSRAIKEMAIADSDEKIADQIEKLLNTRESK